jgi:hypothetical protein
MRHSAVASRPTRPWHFDSRRWPEQADMEIFSLAQRSQTRAPTRSEEMVRTAIEMRQHAPRPGPPHATHASPLSPAVTLHDTHAAQPVVSSSSDLFHLLSMILSENRYPLFGIMLECEKAELFFARKYVDSGAAHGPSSGARER